MGLPEFWEQMCHSPMLMVSTVLTLGVILVNGWTDAPNAIATCVSTRAISARKAIVMAAVFNFLGVLVMTAVNASVAMTIYNMVDFGGNAHISLVAAGISGAAVAIQNSFSGINGAEWMKVIYGILLSTVLGFAFGFAVSKLTLLCARHCNRIRANRFFSGAQVAGGAAMAFMHGAQDGQKFMAIFLLGAAFSGGHSDISSFTVPVWLMILCSAVMGLGTSIGGYRIIKSVGMDMVKLKPYQGFSADLAATLCLLFSSLSGIPVSTTHTKTTAIMGVGAARRMSNVNWKIVKELVLTWVFTFPGCGLLGFIMAKLFLHMFA